MGISQMIAQAKEKFNDMKTKKMSYERQRLAKDIQQKSAQAREAKAINNLRVTDARMDKEIDRYKKNKPQGKAQAMVKGLVRVMNEKRKEHQASGYHSPFSPSVASGPFSNSTFGGQKKAEPKKEVGKTITIKLN
jgi:hypothetical protein